MNGALSRHGNSFLLSHGLFPRTLCLCDIAVFDCLFSMPAFSVSMLLVGRIYDRGCLVFDAMTVMLSSCGLMHSLVPNTYIYRCILM